MSKVAQRNFASRRHDFQAHEFSVSRCGGEGVGDVVAGEGDIHAEGLRGPGAGEGGGGFDEVVAAIHAGVAGTLDPGDAEGAAVVDDAGQGGLAGGIAVGAANEVFDAVRDTVVVVIGCDGASGSVEGLPGSK